MDLPRLMFIDEKCRNLKVVVDELDLTRNIDRKSSELLREYMLTIWQML